MEINVMYFNKRGIKSKINFLKQVLINILCEIIALCETRFQKTEKASIPGYKRIELSRNDIGGGKVGFLTNKSMVKSCFVGPQTNNGI